MPVDCGRLSFRPIYLFTLSRRSVGRKVGRYTFFQSKKHANPNNTQLVSMEGVFVQPQTDTKTNNINNNDNINNNNDNNNKLKYRKLGTRLTHVACHDSIKF